MFVKSILAGMCIGLGGAAYLVVGGIAGAFLFSIALFTICERDYYLYTGKVCYPSWMPKIPVIWFGNLFGCWLISVPFQICGIGISEKAMELITVKLGRIFPEKVMLGILCGICIYIAVDGYKKSKTSIGKYLSLIYGVCVFILCGWEHSIADMYFLLVSGAAIELPLQSLSLLIGVTVGNGLGGLLFPGLEVLVRERKDDI